MKVRIFQWSIAFLACISLVIGIMLMPAKAFVIEPVWIEAEDTAHVTFSDGAVNINDTYLGSGGGTWMGFGATGATAQIKVSVPSAGKYYMEVGYSNHYSYPDKSASLSVNGIVQGEEMTFLPGVNIGANWQFYRTLLVQVDLQEGENTLVLTKTGGHDNVMVFDYFAFSKLGLNTVRFEAENADDVQFVNDPNGAVNINDCLSASGRAWMGFGAAGAKMTMSLYSDTARKAAMTITYSHHYSRDDVKYAQVSVNGAQAGDITFEQGINLNNWDNYRDVSILLDLSEGENAIAVEILAQGNQQEMMIDKIEFREVQGQFETPAAPTLKEATALSIELNAVSGAEYSMDARTWQDSPLFEGLTRATEYTFYVRMKDTADMMVSKPSEGAKFSTRNPFLMTFDTQGGSAIAPVGVEGGDRVAEPEQDPTRTGYTFGGWYAEAECVTPFDFSVPVTQDTTVYAKWTKNYALLGQTVQGEDNNINTFNGVARNEAGENPVYYGIYHFGGIAYWLETYVYVENAGTYEFIVSYAKNTMANGAATGATNILCPVYVNDEHATDIDFTDTGAVWNAYAETQTLIDLEAGLNIVRMEPSETTVGSVMVDWLKFDYRTPRLEGGAIGTGAKVGEEMEAYTFTAEGFEGYVCSIKDGSALPEGLTLSENRLSGTPVHAGEYAFTIVVTANGKSSEADYTLSVGKGTPAQLAAPTLKQASTTSIELNAVAGAEYSMDGEVWQTSPVFEGLTKNTQYMFYIRMAETSDYVAGVSSEATTFGTLNSFMVYFESGDGPAIAAQEVVAGQKAQEPSAPAYTGYTFGGWYKDANFTETFDFETETITGEVIVYVKWTLIQLQVTFETNGGDEIAARTVDYGAVIAAVQPVREGYTFVGWYADAELSVDFDFEQRITEDTTLYAKWEENQPGTEEPGTEEPGTEEPGTEKPGTEEPVTGEEKGCNGMAGSAVFGLSAVVLAGAAVIIAGKKRKE